MYLNEALRSDLRAALATHRFERTGDGRLYLPAARAFVGGAFRHNVNGHDTRISPNNVVYECLNDVLGVYFKQGAQRTAFYISAFAGNVTPDPTTLTAATYASTCTEFNDYSESARPTWTPGAVSAQRVDNSASVGVFTVSVANSTVWGFAMLTASAKSATTGLLVCAAKLASARSGLQIGDKLNVEYDITAADA